MTVIGVPGGGGEGGLQPPQHLRILENLGKFGQGLRFFWANLVKFRIFLVFCNGFFGQLFYFIRARKVSPPTLKWPGTPMGGGSDFEHHYPHLCITTRTTLIDYEVIQAIRL